jgi:hypothetical protein
MVKQKHASLDKLLTAMLQQTSRMDESSNATLEQQPPIEDGYFQAESPVFNRQQQRTEQTNNQTASDLQSSNQSGLPAFLQNHLR